ncbi:MAG TPA: hypothetical protein ENI29_21105 [bacterium]|nr:hypothetical protein [bacterium]
MKIPRRKAKRKVVLESNQDLDQQIDSGSVDFLFLIKNHRLPETKVLDWVKKLNFTLLLLAREKKIWIKGLDRLNNIIYTFSKDRKRRISGIRKISRKERNFLFLWTEIQKNRINSEDTIISWVSLINRIISRLKKDNLENWFNIHKLYSKVMLWGKIFKKKFVVNKYMKLGLLKDKTLIYVKGEIIDQCKYLLLNIPASDIEDETLASIDEFKEKYSTDLETNFDNYDIDPETEFWGHCSNIQAWYESDYNTCLLHSNLAFPLLNALSKAGDKIALKVFKDEIAKRIESCYPPVILFLIKNEYLDFLNEEEKKTVFRNGEILENLIKAVFEVKKYPYKKVVEEIFDILIKKHNLTKLVEI